MASNGRPRTDPHGESLFTPAEEARWKQVRDHPIWQAIALGLRHARDATFSTRPTSDPALWMTWGKIELLTDLLTRGPMLVVEYERANPQPAPVPEVSPGTRGPAMVRDDG